MRNVYFISGLGADKRAFSLMDLSFCNPVFIEWIKPEKKETLQHYALRLAEQITEPDAIIVGLSFGGMLATEIAKQHANYTVVIISSNKTHSEFPKWLMIGKYVPVYKWGSEKLTKKLNIWLNFILGAKGGEQTKIIYHVIKDSDFTFVQWAIEAILHWQNETVPKNLTHIHGTADKLLPYKYVKPHYTINKGEHLMVLNNAKELSDLLREIVGE